MKLQNQRSQRTGPSPVICSANCQPSLRGTVLGHKHWDWDEQHSDPETMSWSEIKINITSVLPTLATCLAIGNPSLSGLHLFFIWKPVLFIIFITFHHVKKLSMTSNPATPHHCPSPGICCHFLLSCLSERLRIPGKGLGTPCSQPPSWRNIHPN